MGACLSCLGLRPSPSDPDRQRLLYDDYNANTTNGTLYGTWGAHAIPPGDAMSAEEMRREQEEFNRITQKASDQIVEIFPHQQNQVQHQHSQQYQVHHQQQQQYQDPHQYPKTTLLPQLNGQPDGLLRDNGSSQLETQSYRDILLSLIPGDKSKRSIRIYPASRPSSSANDAPSVRSKGSNSRLNGGSGQVRDRASGVFVKLDVDLP